MSEFTPITTQEEFDRAIGERLKRERETVKKEYEGHLSPEDVQKKYEGYLSPDDVQKKYEGYLTPEEAAEKDKLIKGYETSSAKMRIAHEYNIPYEMAGRITGETEEDMKKDAQTLAGFLKSGKTYPDYNPDPTKEDDPRNAAMKKMLSNLGGN